MQIRIYPSMNIEVGTGEPGYKWVQGYSQITDTGAETNPSTLSDWRGIAKRDNAKLIVCRTKEEATLAPVVPKPDDSLPGDWYVYRQGEFCHSCRTKAAAVQWAQDQIKAWKQQGAPRWPEYGVAYNRTGGEMEIVK